MRRIFVILLNLLALPLQLALGQTLTVRGTVQAQDALQGLPYVSVGVLRATTGTVTDETGRFTLAAGPNDTLVFSAVGYETVLLPAAAAGSRILLPVRVHSLPMARVTPARRLKKAGIGNLSSPTLVHLGGATQYAMLLRPNSQQASGVLEELVFRLLPETRRNGRWRTAVRVRVYANANGRPGADLLPETLLVTAPKAAKEIKADVSRFLISVPPEGVFIGIDFLGFYDEQGAFVPFSRVAVPLHLRLPFSEGSDHPSFSRFFGTAWQPTRHRGHDGTLVRISAKFGASLSY